MKITAKLDGRKIKWWPERFNECDGNFQIIQDGLQP